MILLPHGGDKKRRRIMHGALRRNIRVWKAKISLTYGVLSPNLLQKVILTVFLCPVRWSKVWHVWNGGLYRCRLAAHSVWLTFSTRCRPMESWIQKEERGGGERKKRVHSATGML